MRRLGSAAAAAAISAATAAGAAGGGGHGADFLNHEAGARPIGLGGAYVAVADDASSLLTNSAGLSRLSAHELTFLHGMTSLLSGARFPTYEFLGYVHGLQPGVGLGGAALVRQIPRIDNPAARLSPDDPAADVRDIGVIVGAGATLESFGVRGVPVAFGATLKIISAKLGDAAATGFGLDLGGHYAVTRDVSAGVSVQNLGAALKFQSASDPLPTKARAGGSFSADLGAAGRLLLSGEAAMLFAEKLPSVTIGAEYGWRGTAFARVGYRIVGVASATGMSAGLGLRASFIALDYSFRPLDYAGLASSSGHFVSASVLLGRAVEPADRRARPASASASRVPAAAGAAPQATATPAAAATPDAEAAARVARSYLDRAHELHRAGNLVDALIELRQATRLRPDYPEAQAMSGRIRAELERKSAESAVGAKADANVQRVIRERFNRGIEHYSRAEYRRAVEEWRIVLELSAFHQQAMQYMDQAQRKLQAAVAEASQQAQQARARRDLAREIRSWETVLAHDPENAKARKSLADARARIPGEVKRLYQAGIDLYTKDQIEQALSAWKQAQELEPASEQVRKAIERAESRLNEQRLRGK